MKRIYLLFCCLTLIMASQSCGGNDNGGNQNSGYYETESGSDSYALSFSSSRDVYNYLNGKTFKGDGLSIMFSNTGQSVYVNGTNISNNVKISDIGLNNNNVAYATVRVINPAGVTTTFTLLAVQGQAKLIDPNDGTIYEY